MLGQTPAFHSSKPKKVGAYGPGASSMPDLAAWTAYVQAVVERYNAPDVTFQVWNEANVEGYWSGTPKQMAQLTAAAREVIDAASPEPTLVAPALAVRTIGQRAWLRDFYAERVGGVPVADLADVLSLQLYPEAGAGPERGLELLAAARESLRLQGVPDDKPIWNTEINYGLQGGEPTAPAPPEQQQANVATTYLLNAAGGIGRVYWYSWDLHTIADTDMVAADNDTLTPGGEAFATVQRWLLGSTVDSCTRANALRVCTLTTPRGPATVYWNPRGEVPVRTGFERARGRDARAARRGAAARWHDRAGRQAPGAGVERPLGRGCRGRRCAEAGGPPGPGQRSLTSPIGSRWTGLDADSRRPRLLTDRAATRVAHRVGRSQRNRARRPAGVRYRRFTASDSASEACRLPTVRESGCQRNEDTGTPRSTKRPRLRRRSSRSRSIA